MPLNQCMEIFYHAINASRLSEYQGSMQCSWCPFTFQSIPVGVQLVWAWWLAFPFSNFCRFFSYLSPICDTRSTSCKTFHPPRGCYSGHSSQPQQFVPGKQKATIWIGSHGMQPALLSKPFLPLVGNNTNNSGNISSVPLTVVCFLSPHLPHHHCHHRSPDLNVFSHLLRKLYLHELINSLCSPFIHALFLHYWLCLIQEEKQCI